MIRASIVAALVCCALALPLSADRHLLTLQTSAPAGWTVLEAPSPTEQVNFFIALKQQNMDAFQKHFEAITDPSNVQYGEYMTMEQIYAIIAPAAEDVALVLSHVSEFSCVNLGDALRCSASVAAVEHVFQTTLRVVRHDASKLTLVRQIGDMSIPSAIAHIVEFVSPLSHFITPNRRNHFRTTAGVFNIVPETLTNMYNITEKGDVRSTQGVVEFAEEDWAYEDTDLQTFSQLTNKKINFTNFFGPPVQPSDPTSLEATLDVQYIGAIGQNNTNWYWKEEQWMFDFTQNLENATSRPNVISMSYAWSEEEQCISLTDQTVCQKLKLNNQQYVERINSEFMKIGALGITITGASGDSGCHGRTDEDCQFATGKVMYPDYPACSPYITSVGGTALVNGVSQNPVEPICTGHGVNCATGGSEVTATTDKGVAEIVSGGGFSNYAPRPSYQDSFVTTYLKNAGSALPPAKDFQSANRGFPDVSALAHNYYVQFQGAVGFVDGTSAASPVWSGIIALINAHRIRLGRPVVGFANPLLYQVWTHTNGAAFQDITVGDNACTEDGCKCKDGFPAIAGWDAATGLGTPNVGRIIQAIDEIDAIREAKKMSL